MYTSYSLNRTGNGTSMQPGNAFVPEYSTPDAKGGDNFFESAVPVQVKVEGNDIVLLEVVYFNSDPDNWITTSFYPQWNPDLIRRIRSTSADIKIGH